MSNNLNFDYKNLTPFKWFILENFPFIEDSIDTLTNYGLFCKLGEEINKNRDSINLIGENEETLTNAFNALHDYVDNYFNNLDVQEEINNKLDQLAADGTLEELLGDYADPYIEEQNARITNLSNDVNSRIANIETEVSRLTSGSPSGVYATVAALTAADPDHSKIYLVTADGNWYYYNGTTWTSGGVYQSTGIDNFSISYQKLKPLNNGNQAITWINGYIASSSNPNHDEGDIDPNAYSANYKRSQPIALTKGMTLIYVVAATANINALSRVDSSNNFISTIESGTDNAGKRVRTYVCQNESEFVCICNIGQYAANPIVRIYKEDYDFDNLVNRSSLHKITTGFIGGFLSDATSSYNSNILVCSTTDGNRFITDFIKVKKGQILYTNAANNATNIDIIGLFNLDFTFNKVVLRGYNNSQLQDHYYQVENDGYIVLSIDTTILPKANLKIELYDSFDEIYNISGYQKLNPVWKNFFINATTYALTPTTTSYQTTEKIPLKKGDVISGFTASTTDSAAKLSISDGVNYTNMIIINNLNSASDYYDPSYRFNYIATEDCFVEILNKQDTLSPSDTDVYINPMSSAVSNVYGKKFTAIGDSYIANQSDQSGNAWASLFANKYGSYYYMRGIGGTGLVEDNGYGLSVLHRLNTIPDDSDFILIVGGKNDYNDQTSLATFKNGISTIIETIQSDHPNSKMMFATPWNTYGSSDSANIKLEEYADAIEEICEKYSVPCFNSFKKSNIFMYDSTFRSIYSQAPDDGSHLNDLGHQRFEERIETFLKSI